MLFLRQRLQHPFDLRVRPRVEICRARLAFECRNLAFQGVRLLRQRVELALQLVRKLAVRAGVARPLCTVAGSAFRFRARRVGFGQGFAAPQPVAVAAGVPLDRAVGLEHQNARDHVV